MLVRPELNVRVVDADSGDPRGDARVVLCRVRIGPPPDEQLDVWTARTDEDGRASFGYRERFERVMPLLPHGVPQRAWHVCAGAEGYPLQAPGGDSRLLVEVPDGDPDKFGRGLDERTLRIRPADASTEPAPCPCRPQRPAHSSALPDSSASNFAFSSE